MESLFPDCCWKHHDLCHHAMLMDIGARCGQLSGVSVRREFYRPPILGVGWVIIGKQCAKRVLVPMNLRYIYDIRDDRIWSMYIPWINTYIFPPWNTHGFIIWLSRSIGVLFLKLMAYCAPWLDSPSMPGRSQISSTGYVKDLHSLSKHTSKMLVSNRNLLFQRSIFGCYISFRECINQYIQGYIDPVGETGYFHWVITCRSCFFFFPISCPFYFWV